MSLDNTTMTELYPYGGAIAYVMYHYWDGVMKQMVMLMDKTRIDYDRDAKKSIPVAKAPKSDDEVKRMTANFGIGKQD